MNATRTGTAGIKAEAATATAAATARTENKIAEQNSSAPAVEMVAMAAAGTGSTPALPLRKTLLRALALTAAAGIAFGLYHWWDYTRTWIKTDNAYVTAHIHQVSSRVAGTVSDVLVQDNQVIEAGAIVARLDRRDFEIRRQQALAQVAQAQAQQHQAQAQMAQARAEVAREEAQSSKAQKDLERARTLSAGSNGAISKQEFDTAQAAATAAAAGLAAAQSALESANALAIAAQAQEQAAQASLKEAELQLTYTDVVAPAAGRVGRKALETGNRIQPGQALIALVEPEVWVVANFKETQLAQLRPGASVRLEIDAFPGHTFTGRVDSLAPASGAQFALLPPDNATGNFTKIVQRVPVKIVFDRKSLGDYYGRIAAGMSVVVEARRTAPAGRS